MSNTKKKQTGLGAEAYFSDIPNLDEPEPEKEISKKPSKKKLESTSTTQKSTGQLVRRTYALSQEAMLGLEAMKLQARISGQKTTLSSLLDEAVTELMKKKGLAVDDVKKAL